MCIGKGANKQFLCLFFCKNKLRRELFVDMLDVKDVKDEKVANGQMNQIETQYATFVPQYTEGDAMFERTKKTHRPISYHKNGTIKSIALENQTKVKTPLGQFLAELVTFYDDGSLHKVFPLNGKITGFWTEEDEGNLAQPHDFSYPFGNFSAKIISVRFYPSGALKSLTLWPGEVITLSTSVGEIETRIGFSLYEDGTLKSVEPAKPVEISTPIGVFMAYDYDAIGVHADANSIVFSENGDLIGFKSSVNGVIVMKQDGTETKIMPKEVESYVEASDTVVLPISVEFQADKVVINNGVEHEFSLTTDTFEITSQLRSGCGSKCSSCSGCH